MNIASVVLFHFWIQTVLLPRTAPLTLSFYCLVLRQSYFVPLFYIFTISILRYRLPEITKKLMYQVVCIMGFLKFLTHYMDNTWQNRVFSFLSELYSLCNHTIPSSPWTRTIILSGTSCCFSSFYLAAKENMTIWQTYLLQPLFLL